MASTAEIVKQCKVKTSSVKRLHKELGYYEKERDKEQARVDKMKSEGADASDVKQAVSREDAKPHVDARPPEVTSISLYCHRRPPQENVLQESAMMIPQTRQRLEAALSELQSFVVRGAGQALCAPPEYKLLIPQLLAPTCHAHVICKERTQSKSMPTKLVPRIVRNSEHTRAHRGVQPKRHACCKTPSTRGCMACVTGAREHARWSSLAH